MSFYIRVRPCTSDRWCIERFNHFTCSWVDLAYYTSRDAAYLDAAVRRMRDGAILLCFCDGALGTDIHMTCTMCGQRSFEPEAAVKNTEETQGIVAIAVVIVILIGLLFT